MRFCIYSLCVNFGLFVCLVCECVREKVGDEETTGEERETVDIVESTL